MRRLTSFNKIEEHDCDTSSEVIDELKVENTHFTENKHSDIFCISSCSNCRHIRYAKGCWSAFIYGPRYGPVNRTIQRTGDQFICADI